MLPTDMCLYICDYVKSWPSMYATKLDEILTNQLSLRGVQSLASIYCTCSLGFGVWNFLPTVKKNLGFSYTFWHISTHNFQKIHKKNFQKIYE